jgi:large subunit ribosomal protein L4e
LGRFVIWTQSAFALLDQIYGTYRKPSALKKDYTLPFHKVANADITRIINSAEIQGSLKAAGPAKTPRPYTQKKNPLKSMAVMTRLNPYAVTLRRAEILQKTQKKSTKKTPKTSAAFLSALHAD